jgi:hypothetical protein
MTRSLLVMLAERGISLREKDGAVAASCTPDAITDEIRRLIKTNKADLLKAIRGDIEPRPCMRSLANAYRRRSGEGFREAFQRVTGCDIWKETPEWIALYTFQSWMASEAPPNARQRDSPIGMTTASANQMGGWEP